MIRFCLFFTFLLLAAPAQAQTGTIDPVTTENVPRYTIPIEDEWGEDIIAQARAEVCENTSCAFTFSNPAEIAGSMCWNDIDLGQAFCRDAVVGTTVEVCEPQAEGAQSFCWQHDMIEGEISSALASDPRLDDRTINWLSRDKANIARDEIRASDYCASLPEAGCARLYNIGEILFDICSAAGQCAGGRDGWIFEHCWDDHDGALARCRQALITPGEAAD